MGPAAFDLGCVLGCLLLAWVTLGWSKNTDSAQQRQRQRAWLADSAAVFWQQFSAKYGAMQRAAQGTQHDPAAAQAAEAALDEQAMFRDMVGFAAFYMIRLTIGMHSYPGYEIEVAPGDMPEAQAAMLRLARAMLHMRAGPECSLDSVLALLA